MLRFIDIFAGTGGIRLALEMALKSHGLTGQCVKSVEIDENVCMTYEMNFGENPSGDIRDVIDIPQFDIMLAGFPCQTFSYAGKRQGFADTRGTMFFEVERLLEKYRPKICFLENVRGLVSHDGGRTFEVIIDKLEKLGYNVEYRLINASAMGMPQNRTRVYIIGMFGEHPNITIDSDLGVTDSHAFTNRTTNLFSDKREQRLVQDVLEETPPSCYDCSEQFIKSLEDLTKGELSRLHGVRLIDTRNGKSVHSWQLGLRGKCSEAELCFMNRLIANRRRHTFGTHQDGKELTLDQIRTFYEADDIEDVALSLIKKGYLRESSGKYNPTCGNMSFEVFKFLDPKSISITLTSSDCNRLGIYHNGRVRRLTPRECARLQGYPDSYILHPVDALAYKQIGNAVCVPVIQSLFEDLFKHNPSIGR